MQFTPTIRPLSSEEAVQREEVGVPPTIMSLSREQEVNRWR